MENVYDFNPSEAVKQIEDNWKAWVKLTGAKKFVLGISGGKDSTVVAWLATKLWGRENVIGVRMPNGEMQACNKDSEIAKAICTVLGIRCIDIDISAAFNSICNEAFDKCLDKKGEDIYDYDEAIDSPARVNLPPRLRMATLFCVAQQFKNAVVLCTDNLSESILGYSTFGGDGFGCYAPLKDLTVTEVKQVAAEIGVPEFLYAKVPSDGLQDKTDEQRFGFTYADVDKCIRTFSSTEPAEIKRLRERIFKDYYLKNKFKTDIVNVPGPIFNYPNFIKNKQ